MKLTPALREVLKKPLGKVVRDASSVPRDALIIAIGDTTSENLINGGIRPKIAVYDGKTHRKDIGVTKAISSYDAREHRIPNPAGRLEEEVFTLFRKLLKEGSRSRVYVDGEEDLTALAAIMEAPLGALVVYGQPDEGLVVVEVDDETKNKVKNIIKEMEDGS